MCPCCPCTPRHDKGDSSVIIINIVIIIIIIIIKYKSLVFSSPFYYLFLPFCGEKGLT